MASLDRGIEEHINRKNQKIDRFVSAKQNIKCITVGLVMVIKIDNTKKHRKTSSILLNSLQRVGANVQIPRKLTYRNSIHKSWVGCSNSCFFSKRRLKVVFKLMLKAYETNPDEFEWHHSKAIHRSKILEVDFYKNITKFLQSN
jgi:hypothetical protein